MVLIAKNTIVHGRRSGFLTAVGTLVGVSVHAVAAVLGLSAILATSATAFTVVKFAGAAYLVFLGVQALRDARASASSSRPMATDLSSETGSQSSGFVQGVVTNVLNPKVALFFLTFLPQFVDPGGQVLLQTLLLASIFWVMGALWLGFYTLLVGRLSVFLSRPRVARVLQRVTGVILVGLGVRLAVDRR
jgi:threonine/homoserine/homoserine lactone efflux protein